MKQFGNNIRKAKDTFMSLWRNPRTRAMMILTLYFFLFLFLITSIRHKPKETVMKEKEEIETKESFGTLDNYEYDMNILYKNTTGTANYIISGMRYQESHMFHTNESLIPYYVKEDGIYQKQGTELILSPLNYGINLYQLSPKLISSLVLKAELQSKVSYEDTGSKYLYQMPVIEFLALYDQNSPLLLQLPQGDILFYIYEKENMVEKVELDLTPFYMLTDETTTSYMVTIEYKNIGKVKAFEMGNDQS